MPVYVAAAKKLHNLNSNRYFVIPAANQKLAEMIQSTKGISDIPYKLSIDSAQDFLSLSSISIVIDTDGDGVPDSIAQNPYGFQQLRDPIGGNFLVEGSLQLIFKLPMIEDQDM